MSPGCAAALCVRWPRVVVTGRRVRFLSLPGALLRVLRRRGTSRKLTAVYAYPSDADVPPRISKHRSAGVLRTGAAPSAHVRRDTASSRVLSLEPPPEDGPLRLAPISVPAQPRRAPQVRSEANEGSSRGRRAVAALLGIVTGRSRGAPAEPADGRRFRKSRPERVQPTKSVREGGSEAGRTEKSGVLVHADGTRAKGYRTRPLRQYEAMKNRRFSTRSSLGAPSRLADEHSLAGGSVRTGVSSAAPSVASRAEHALLRKINTGNTLLGARDADAAPHAQVETIASGNGGSVGLSVLTCAETAVRCARTSLAAEIVLHAGRPILPHCAGGSHGDPLSARPDVAAVVGMAGALALTSSGQPSPAPGVHFAEELSKQLTEHATEEKVMKKKRAKSVRIIAKSSRSSSPERQSRKSRPKSAASLHREGSLHGNIKDAVEAHGVSTYEDMARLLASSTGAGVSGRAVSFAGNADASRGVDSSAYGLSRSNSICQRTGSVLSGAALRDRHLSRRSSTTGQTARQELTETKHLAVGTYDGKVAGFYNQYAVVKTIGSGANGDVKLCMDMTTSTLVAVKLVQKAPAGQAGSASRRVARKPCKATTLKQEAAVLTSLEHPNVVKVHEVIDDEKAPHVLCVMEYVEGGSVQMEEGEHTSVEFGEGCFAERLSEATAHDYFLQLVDALDYLHDMGVVHGDIKPANLLLGADGNVRLADFGSATAFGRGGDDTMLAVRGTPAFLAPEICMGEEYSGRAADVWASGVTLFLMLTGRLPFGGPKMTMFRLYDAIIDDELTFPDDVALSDDVKTLLHKLLEKDPKKRATLDEVICDAWVGSGWDAVDAAWDAADAVQLSTSQRSYSSATRSALQLLPASADGGSLHAPDENASPVRRGQNFAHSVSLPGDSRDWSNRSFDGRTPRALGNLTSPGSAGPRGSFSGTGMSPSGAPGGPLLSVIRTAIDGQHGGAPMPRRTFEPGDVLMAEGSSGDHMLFILSGQAEVLKRTSDTADPPSTAAAMLSPRLGATPSKPRIVVGGKEIELNLPKAPLGRYTSGRLDRHVGSDDLEDLLDHMGIPEEKSSPGNSNTAHSVRTMHSRAQSNATSGAPRTSFASSRAPGTSHASRQRPGSSDTNGTSAAGSAMQSFHSSRNPSIATSGAMTDRSARSSVRSSRLAPTAWAGDEPVSARSGRATPLPRPPLSERSSNLSEISHTSKPKVRRGPTAPALSVVSPPPKLKASPLPDATTPPVARTPSDLLRNELATTTPRTRSRRKGLRWGEDQVREISYRVLDLDPDSKQPARRRRNSCPSGSSAGSKTTASGASRRGGDTRKKLRLDDDDKGALSDAGGDEGGRPCSAVESTAAGAPVFVAGARMPRRRRQSLEFLVRRAAEGAASLGELLQPDVGYRGLARREAGDVVGEAALLGQAEVRTATVRAVTRVEALEVDRSGLEKLAEAFPRLQHELRRVMAERTATRRMMEAFERLADLHRRIAPSTPEGSASGVSPRRTPGRLDSRTPPPALLEAIVEDNDSDDNEASAPVVRLQRPALPKASLPGALTPRTPESARMMR
ncbi:unnamed protein product [Pedinophyceae sp. YPF-701]|nr:unnamed protein product [Pedinophyceae sp. YPF-701]